MVEVTGKGKRVGGNVEQGSGPFAVTEKVFVGQPSKKLELCAEKVLARKRDSFQTPKLPAICGKSGKEMARVVTMKEESERQGAPLQLCDLRISGGGGARCPNAEKELSANRLTACVGT